MRIKISYDNENFKNLDISSIEDIPKDIFYLDISHNELTSFDPNLPNLQILDIYTNNLISFDPKNLPKLQTLNIYYNKLISFDPKNLPNLQILNINDNKLILFDPKNLLNLKELNISNNKLTSFNPNLPNLEYLDIYINKLILFDPKNLLNLKELNIWGNNFKKQKIILRRRVYLFSENPPKETVEDMTTEREKEARNELTEVLNTHVQISNKEKCYKCKKNIKNYLKINIRKLIFLNNNISCYTCC